MNEINMSRNERLTEETMLKVKKHIAQYKDKKTIKVDHLSTTKTMMIGTPDKMRQRKELLPQYDDLLIGKINDSTTKNEVIKFAEIIMQPTTYCDIELQNKGINIANLKVICCLPDHSNIFAKYWIGKTINYNNFPALVQKFQQLLKNYNISNVIITTPPTPGQDQIIQGTNNTFTYA